MDDPGFGGMHFELAFRQPLLKFSLEGLSFFLGPTVHQPIVSIPTPWEVRVFPYHPEIKCVVQEQIRKNRTNYGSLRGSARSPDAVLILFHGCCQPSLDLEQRPFASYILPDRFEQEVMRNVVEQSFDVEL